MSSPSVKSVIQKLRFLLSHEEKLKWLGIVGFAFIVSVFEVITASVIVVFAQVLNDPKYGQKYLSWIGLHENLASGQIVFYFAMACGVMYLLKNLVAAFETFYQNLTIQKMSYQFKNKMLHKYASADYGFYLTRNSSLGSSVIGGDIEQMFSSGMIALASIISESIVFLALVSMIVFMNPLLALVLFFVAGGLGVIANKWLSPFFYKWGQKLQESALSSGQHLSQFFYAFKDVILLGKRDAFINAYHFHSKRRSTVQALHSATNNLPRLVIEVLFVGLFVVTISYMCWDQNTPVQMMGTLGGYLYAGFRLMPGLNRIISQMNTLKGVTPNVERVYAEYTLVSMRGNYVDVPELKFAKSLVFNNVSFRYLNTKKDALTAISLEINKGDCIGIVGETGSGKSTLVDLVLGLLNPYEGTVLVDDQYPVHSYQWHQKIGYVPQSVYLIDDTIEANIAFGEEPKDVDQARLIKAIEDAQLERFIKQLPLGTKTFVGERGIRLSGGERQRISIARALYRNPEVLIFDEATSALDNETEARLMETIQAVSQHRTVIMVAHRLTTLQWCDRILVMEKGTIKKITDYKNLQTTKMVNNG